MANTGKNQRSDTVSIGDVDRMPDLHGQRLSPCQPEDEFLHSPASSGHYSATETTYWGFNIPEKQLNGEIYMWFHPVLRMCSASVYIWTGIRASTLSCEYVNHYHYLPFPEDDIEAFTVADDMDLRFKVIEPLKRIAIEYRDEARNVSFSILNEAIMPPAGRPGGGHFTQAMKVTGSLNLFGETHEIDGYFSRDHSWGEERRETSRIMPPLSWIVGVADDDFAFHCCGFDDPRRNPSWAAAYPQITPENTLRWGYIFKEGEVVPVKTMSKLTHREDDGVSPTSYDLTLVDGLDRTFDITGTVEARMPWQTWQNMNVYFSQTRWEVDGKIAYGDAQDVQFNHFIHNFDKRSRDKV
ncbi:DUF7064 domain-containing protein [Henriciella litoralis]|uniref:DUF7064 domain-containing protein n=1 Tax=Henriciella litoralis TaxID=568102 RepID=UPI0009FD64A6|nr:hypothetical protein [Henriciella litoralis]